ncbi:MAG: hypothetical protein KC449_07945 [Anaerolineales bacterium]|nr:hypothetical protein [Anaerolineales bacterium]
MNFSASIEPSQIRPLIHAVLREWHKPDSQATESFTGLLLTQQLQAENEVAPLLDTIHTLLRNFLNKLADQDTEGANVLQQRFLDQNTVRQVAQEIGLSIDSTNRIQQQALVSLATLIAQAENQLRDTRISQMESLLPSAPYKKLFGRDTLVQRLVADLESSETHPFIALAGLGGIGKTAVAHAIAQAVLWRFMFQQVLWLHLEAPSMHGYFPEPEQAWLQLKAKLIHELEKTENLEANSQDENWLRHQLKNHPSLIIIDNLEDQKDVDFIIKKLGHWARPSLFLLTTRSQPATVIDVLTYSLEELTQAESFNFIRFEANHRGLSKLATASKSQLMPIYQITGGHPLALKLIAGLATSVPLTAILEDLKRDRPGPTDDMYRNIYRRAWQSLSPNARLLLQSMPLIGKSGALPEQMIAVCQLGEAPFWEAVQELFGRSLLEVRGTVWERRYGIHQLTETFLNTEINRWDV